MYDEVINGDFCRVCRQTTAESATQHTGGVWVTKPFQNWKKATERMKAHERSSSTHKPVKPCLVLLKQGSVVQQLQRVGVQEREKNRAAMKSQLTVLFTVPISPTELIWLYLVGLENCKFSLKMPQGMQYTLRGRGGGGFDFIKALGT